MEIVFNAVQCKLKELQCTVFGTSRDQLDDFWQYILDVALTLTKLIKNLQSDNFTKQIELSK